MKCASNLKKVVDVLFDTIRLGTTKVMIEVFIPIASCELSQGFR